MRNQTSFMQDSLYSKTDLKETQNLFYKNRQKAIFYQISFWTFSLKVNKLNLKLLNQVKNIPRSRCSIEYSSQNLRQIGQGVQDSWSHTQTDKVINTLQIQTSLRTQRCLETVDLLNLEVLNQTKNIPSVLKYFST